MFGLLYGLASLLLRGTAEVVENNRIRKENNTARDKHLYELNNQTNFSGTYFSNTGERDVFSNERVERRINEKGEQIVFSIKSKMDIRNITELEREFEFNKRINEAKNNNKTVVLKWNNHETVKMFYRIPLEKCINEIYKVPDYQNCTKWVRTDKIENPNYIKGDRYYDLMTNKECVIRVFKKDNKRTSFYMCIDDGHLIRRTDNQIINDKNYPEKNYISIDDTENFIKEFNEMQDQNKPLLKNDDFYYSFWYNTKDNYDYIYNIEQETFLNKMKHFEV